MRNAPDGAPAPMTPTRRSVTLHGQVLSYLDSGPARPGSATPAPGTQTVLFVHGLMSSAATWAGQVARLAPRHRGIAPDLFGHGQSDKPVGDYSLSAHAASLRDLLDALDIRSVTMVGHSLGGGIALQFAYLFPDRVAALVLVSSGGLGRELNLLLRAATLPGSELVLPVVASGWLHDIGDTVLKVWSGVGLPAISPSSEEAWQSLRSLADGHTRRAFLASSRSVIDAGGQTVNAQNRLASFASRSSMLIWGKRDRMIPATHLDNARRELPASRIELFDRSGHFPHADEPDRFARVLGEFLTGPITDGSEPGTTAPPQITPMQPKVP